MLDPDPVPDPAGSKAFGSGLDPDPAGSNMSGSGTDPAGSNNSGSGAPLLSWVAIIAPALKFLAALIFLIAIIHLCLINVFN